MLLKKILLAYNPPGLGFVYNENNIDSIKHISLTELNENTDTFELTTRIINKEPKDITPHKSKIHTAIMKIQRKIIEKKKFAQYNAALIHFLPVTNIAIDNMGSNCVTGNYDRTARIWDLKTATEVQTLEGHNNVVFSVTFNKHGNKVLTGSFDKTVKIWDAKTGNMDQTFLGHTDEIVSAQFLPDEETIISASTDATVRIFQTETGQEVKTCIGHTKDVVCVQVDNAAKYIVSGSLDKTIRIWDPRNGNCLHVLCGHEGEISNCKINDEGTMLVSGSFDGRTIVWDLRRMKYYKIFPVHTTKFEKVLDVDLKGCLIGASSAEGSAWVWDIENEGRQWELEGHRGAISKICFNRSREEVMTCSEDHTVRLWNLASARIASETLEHEDAVFSCVFSQCGKKIVSACKDNSCKLWFRY